MILDQAGYHKSGEVTVFAEQNGIKLHYLPAYSPNLNPIERLWKVIDLLHNLKIIEEFLGETKSSTAAYSIVH